VLEAPGPVRGATLGGKPLDLEGLSPEERKVLFIEYWNLTPEGIEIAATMEGTGSVKVTLFDRSSGLPVIPGLTIQPRPADMMAAPDMPDPTVVRKAFVVGD
jgi:hypothetical protein